MKLNYFKSILLIVTFVVSSFANAGLIYNVNLDHGTGSVIGTIETDGTIGNINLVNIVNINLSFQSTNVINNELQLFSTIYSDGSAFTASSNELTFDFINNSNGLYTLFWFTGQNSSSQSYWCLNGASTGSCDGNAAASSLGYKTNPQLDVLTGISTIATRGNATISNIPEPSTFAVFILGVMGLITRKFFKNA
jgi:hypothetical protein